MKKLLFLLAACLLLAVSLPALSEMARDVTGECSFQMPYIKTRVAYMTDRDYETAFECDKLVEPVLTITTGETPVSALYMEFGKNRLPFQVQVKQGDDWVLVASSGAYYAQEYVAFPPVQGEFRVRFITNGYAEEVTISEIHLLSEGDLDKDTYHIWRDTVRKADLMITVAHPDDELLWMGGCIPYYATERNMDVLLVYLTCSNSYRELELLNGLWHCGVRTYPVIAYLPDFKTFFTDNVYKRWDRADLNYYLVDLIRHYRPEVVVTHALNGEYGHAQHIVCAYATQRAVEYAAQTDYHKASFKEYGAWQVKKFYLHQGEKPTTVMDWHVRFDSMGGKSSFEIASEAYQMHISQMGGDLYYEVADRGTEYDSFVYTLAHSTVGEDTVGGDLFENVPPEELTTFYYKFAW